MCLFQCLNIAKYYCPGKNQINAFNFLCPQAGLTSCHAVTKHHGIKIQKKNSQSKISVIL